MTPDSIAQLIERYGVGMVAIIAVGWIGYSIITRVMKYADDFYELVKKGVENHLAHHEQYQKETVENGRETNSLLRQQGKSLDAQSQILQVIVSQTKPKE